MRRFAQLYAELDASTATNDKLAALGRYFAEAAAGDAAWAVYFLIGGKPRQVVPTSLVRATACRLAGIDDWLFEECYQAVGDLAETVAHVLPPGGAADEEGLAHWVEQRLLPLRGLTSEAQAERLAEALGRLDPTGRFLLVKLIGGGFRVGVSRLLVQRALAQHAGIDAGWIAERLMGWTDSRAAAPSAERFAELVDTARGDKGSAGQPYPFFLAHALQAASEDLPTALGSPAEWIVEWKYDGIRAQLVRRAGRCWIWSRGEELVTERFPEIAAAAAALPEGTVLDGEILAWREDRTAPEPFNRLQQRIGRKTLTKKILADVPVVFVGYDVLERDGIDLRGQPQALRRETLEALLPEGPWVAVSDPAVTDAGSEASAAHAAPRLRRSPRLPAADWSGHAAQREHARALGVEGLMLKHRDARYGSGRTKSEGVWWKWKVNPLSVDAVLIYAQAGHGRRASVYTDYTFAVWSRPPVDEAEAQVVVEAIARREPARPGALQLVPFAKAYSGLTDEEFAQVDRVIRRSTLEKFGPVRSVRPSLVFELGFEGLGPSPRHKSGIAVRFPRMLRLRPDKPLWQADSLETLRALMAAGTPPP